VVDIPQSGVSYFLSRAVSTQPVVSPGVERPLLKVADESDGVPFDVRSVAIRAGFVVRVDPQKREVPSILAHPPFVVVFRKPSVAVGSRSFSPVGILAVEVVAFEKRFPDALPKNRTSVVAAASIRPAVRSSVSPESVP
jgi:hypothetical protein